MSIAAARLECPHDIPIENICCGKIHSLQSSELAADEAAMRGILVYWNWYTGQTWHCLLG